MAYVFDGTFENLGTLLFLTSLAAFCYLILSELPLFHAFLLMPISWLNYKLFCPATFFRHFGLPANLDIVQALGAG